MAANLTESGPPVSELVAGIIHDAQTLMTQQLALFKQEVRQDLVKARDVAKSLAFGVGLLLMGSLFLSLMLVFLLNWLVPNLPLWACFGILGAAFAIGGGILTLIGNEQLRTVNPAEQTTKSLEENLEWKTKPTTLT